MNVTYQDLLDCGQDERRRMDFIRSAVQGHQSSTAYKIASAAEEYYAKRNVTISKFQKLLYDFTGKAQIDMTSANYKLKTSFFRRFVTQQVQYVLSNGVTFANPDTKEKLGRGFDNQLQLAAKWAMIDGVSFLFWNLDHVEVFGFSDTRIRPGYAPVHDDTTGLMMAGVRYWNIGTTARYTLYEIDGYTDYIVESGKDGRVLYNKRAYKMISRADPRSRAEGLDETAYVYENYPGFPIVPLYANDLLESEIVGLRESIDCYDFIKSGFANEIDDTSGFYWVLKNAGGMDDVDIQEFLNRMRKVRAASIDVDAGTDIEAHTLDIPVAAREAMLDRLEADLYKDAQIVNVSDLSSASKTATEIRFAYQPMDDKAGDFEFCIRSALEKLFAIAGIDDEPSFKWNRIANQTEETQMVLTAAEYLDEEAVLKHLPWLTPEEVEEILDRKAAEDLNRFHEVQSGGDLESEASTTDEAIDAAEEAVGKTLNGSQTASLISVIQQLTSGGLTEGQAARILMTSIGVTREEAFAIIRGEE